MSPRLVRWLLLALVVWSLLLRLGFASYGLGPERFFDERYSLENLHALLAPAPEGSPPSDSRFLDRFRPANGWYPSLSYLPQAPLLAASVSLHRTTGAQRLAIFQGDQGNGFTPTAYWLCRATVALFGALTLVLTYLLARRLFDSAFGPATSAFLGLLAALLLSASPTHLRQSAMFKPDMLLTLLTLAVCLLTLRLAVRRDRPAAEIGAGALAGLAVGLATASKLNGLLTVLLPLSVLAVRAVRDRSWKPLAALAATGLTAGAVFLALNPFPGLFAEYLDRNLRIYGERAELAGLDRLSAFEAIAEHLLSPGFHGLVLGLIAVTGLIGLGGVVTWRERRGHLALAGLIPLWVGGYVVLYTGTTAYPKANNLLPVLPFTALAAAWLLVVVGRALGVRAARRWPVVGRTGVRRAAGVVGILVVGVVLLAPLHLYAYRAAVPTTRELAQLTLTGALQPFAGRRVLFEGFQGLDEGEDPSAGSPPILLSRRDAVAVERVRDLDALSRESRRLADAEVSFQARAEADVHILPALGRAWGPRWSLRLHPWEAVSHRRHWADTVSPRSWLLPLPERTDDEQDLWISVQLLVRDPEPPSVPPRLEVEGREVALHATRIETGGYVYGAAYTSSRVPLSPETEIRAVFPLLPESERPRRPPVADVLVWREPELSSR